MTNKKVFEIEYFAVSDIGKARANHEDNLLLSTGELLAENQIDKTTSQISFEGKLAAEPADVLHFAVADGMGGHNAGEVASCMAVNKLKEFVSKWRPETQEKAVLEYKKFITELNTAVKAFGKTGSIYANLGTTLASVIFYKNKLTSFNIGDSRVYSFTAKGLRRLSKDHTEGQLLIDIGIINDEVNDLYRARNLLTRFIGMNENSKEELSYVSKSQELSDSDIFLICSDGLTSAVSDRQIEEVLLSSKGEKLSVIGNKLIETSFDKTLSEVAGCDNVTIILLRVLKNKNKAERKFLKFLLRGRRNGY